MPQKSPEISAFDHRKVMVGTFYLMMGNVISQVINLAGLLFLARIYDPGSVGLWALFLGIGFGVQFLGGLHYDLALIIVDDDRDAARLALLGIGVSVVMALMFVIVLELLIAGGFGWVPDQMASFSLYFLPYIICYGLFNTGMAWGIRTQKYPWLMATRISIPFFTLIFQFLLRDTTKAGNGLILGTVIAYLVTAAWCTAFLWRPLAAQLGGYVKTLLRDMRSLARRERGFPMLSIPRALIVSFANQAVVVILGILYSLPVVGSFNLAYRALYAPMLLIGSALAQAIMPSLSKSKAAIYELEGQLMAIVRILGWIYLPALVFIIAFGPSVFIYVFGDQWGQAGEYAAYLTMALFGMALTMWFEKIFDILDRQKLHLILGAALNAGALIAFLLAHSLTRNPDVMIIAWSAAMLVYAGIWLAIAFHICGFNLKRLLLIGIELSCVTAALAVFVPMALEGEEYWQRVMNIAAVFSSYGLLAWLFLRKDMGFFLGQLLRRN